MLSRLDRCSSLLDRMIETRTNRLSSECLSLPVTHYAILGTLGLLLLLCLPLVSAASLVAAQTDVPLESSILFGGLTSVYVLAFSFSLEAVALTSLFRARKVAAGPSLTAPPEQTF